MRKIIPCAILILGLAAYGGTTSGHANSSHTAGPSVSAAAAKLNGDPEPD
jgi:hypothetical protein